MQKFPTKFYIGIAIIFIGIVILLNNLDLIHFDENFWWGLAFIVLGALLLRVYRMDQSRKGPLWVGLGFLLGGALFWIDAVAGLPGDWIGIIIMWFLAAAFAYIFIQKNSRWWAALIAGILFTSGAVNFISNYHLVPSHFESFIFFMGVSLSFWFLYLIRNDENPMPWTGYTAMALTIFAFFVLSQEWHSKVADILLPLSVILGGVFLIFIRK